MWNDPLVYKEVYFADYRTSRDVATGLARYFHLYNEQRPHQSLAYQVPAAVYFAASDSPLTIK
jgi:putative transposase